MTALSVALVLPLAFAALVALVILAAVRTWKGNKRRRQANLAFAGGRGWSLVPEDPAFVDFCVTAPFGLGDGRRATEVTRGTYRDRGFVAFGYQYDTESTDGQGHSTRTTHHLRIASVAVAGRIPIVRITPEGVFSRMAEAMGGRDIDVESEDFNRHWRVWSKDQRAAHAILAPNVIQRLLQPDASSRPFVFEPGLLMTYEAGPRDLTVAEERLDRLCDVADLVPKFLADDYR